MKYNILIYYLLSFVLIVLFLSCEDKERIVEVEETTSRLFRPPLLEANINGNEVEFKWIPIKNARYLLELSRDSMAFNNELKSFEIKDTNHMLIGDLWSESRYSARIKAISGNEGVDDSGYQEVTFITGTENIFYGILDDQITDKSILLKWDKSKQVSKINVYVNSIMERTVNLTSQDIASGQKSIDDLSGNTVYTFKIYREEMLRGTISGKTSD